MGDVEGVTWALRVRLAALLEDVQGGLDALANLLVRADDVNLNTQHLHSLERSIELVVLDKVAGKEENLHVE